MQGKKELKWLPVVSFCCVLFLLFSVGTFVSVKVGKYLIGLVTSIATLGAFFPRHLESIMNNWSEKIINETHYSIMFICILAGLISIFLSQQYRIKCEIINKNENE